MTQIDDIERYIVRLGLMGIRPQKAYDKTFKYHMVVCLPEDISFKVFIGNGVDGDITYTVTAKKNDYLDVTDMYNPRPISAMDFSLYYTLIESSFEQKSREFDEILLDFC